MRRYVIAFVVVVLGGVAGLFATRNTVTVAVDLFFSRVEAPLVIWLLAAAIFGVLLTLLCMVPGWWRSRARQRRLRRDLADAKAECDRLRRAPLEDR